MSDPNFITPHYMAIDQAQALYLDLVNPSHLGLMNHDREQLVHLLKTACKAHHNGHALPIWPPGLLLSFAHDFESTRFLLLHGASIFDTNHMKFGNLLHLAASRKDEKFITFLLERHTPIDVTNHYGGNALFPLIHTMLRPSEDDIAVKNRCFKLLMDHGIDTTVRISDGRSALEFAISYADIDISWALLRHENRTTLDGLILRRESLIPLKEYQTMLRNLEVRLEVFLLDQATSPAKKPSVTFRI